MAKPHPTTRQGSGCHVHISLIDNKTGENAFHGSDFELNEGVTCSSTLLYFLGGWMKYARDMFVFSAPTVNSYKRYL